MKWAQRTSFGNSKVLSSIRRLRSQTSTTFESRRASASSFSNIDANNSAEEGEVVEDNHESKVHFAQGEKDETKSKDGTQQLMREVSLIKMSIMQWREMPWMSWYALSRLRHMHRDE